MILQRKLQLVLRMLQQIYLMSIKRSENYVYFQNRATHYHNIENAKNKVQDHLKTNHRNTIDHSQRIFDRDLPYNKKYQMDEENKKFADRLVSINGNFKREEVRIGGSYSRFHKFQRNFRRLNPQKDEEQRKIMQQNERIRRKIESTRARIGNNSVWQADYKIYDKYKKLSCRYEDNQKTKIQLVIDKETYMPDHYLKFLEQLNHSSSDKSLKSNSKMQGSRTSRNKSKQYRIDPEKMFVLPSIQIQQHLQKSKSNSNLSQLSSPKIQAQNNS